MKTSNHKYIKVAIIGYASYLFIGGVLLTLSISQVSGEHGNFIDSLFMASSAISTTGLATVSLNDYTFFGQFVLLCLIQIGGLGYMTIGAFVFTSIRKTTTSQREFVQKSMANVLKENPMKFLRKIVFYSLIVEFIGTICLIPAMMTQTSSTVEAVWYAIFHSVSAFCTAGFSTFDQNFMVFANNNFAMFVLSILMLLGGLGFIVAFDVIDILRRKRKTVTFTTKIILFMFVALITSGIVSVYINEGTTHSLMQVWFTVVSAISGAGFNVYPMTMLNPAVGLTFICLMTIGAAPLSTGGGIKVNNVAITLLSLKAYIRGNEYASIRGSRLSKYDSRKAIAAFLTYLLTLIFAIYLFCFFQPNFTLQQSIFEVSSALATAGLSMGITGDLNNANKLLLTAVMFIGRVGPIILFDYCIFYLKPKNIIEDEIVV